MCAPFAFNELHGTGVEGDASALVELAAIAEQPLRALAFTRGHVLVQLILNTPRSILN